MTFKYHVSEGRKMGMEIIIYREEKKKLCNKKFSLSLSLALLLLKKIFS